MSKLPYDISSAESILQYAHGLSGKTLEEAANLDGYSENLSNKGDLGQMVERYYFLHTPPNDHEPDFAEAGVELKTTGVKKLKNGEYRAKERLVLTLINFSVIAEETWQSNSFLYKCSQILLLFYLFEKNLPVYKRRFVFEPLLWTFPKEDLEIIKQDWLKIQQKIIAGNAHELSEGDTFYLGACRKGSGGAELPISQPNSSTLAMRRAYSFKSSYMNMILAGHAKESTIVNSMDDAKLGIDKLVTEKLKPYEGMTTLQISESLNLHRKGKTDKGFSKSLAMRMLGTTGRTLPEFEKAGIEAKIVTLQANGSPTEYMSFPTFDYINICDEEWEDSTFFAKLEQKFLFIIFKRDKDKTVRFYKSIFWNMPYEDRMQAKLVWSKTKKQIMNHDAANLPKIIDNPVAHVRPKGADNTVSLFPTPQGEMLPRKGFWLNKKYIARQIAIAEN